MKDIKIVALVGMPGSGKGTCSNYLNDEFGWPVVHFGNMVYEEVQRRNLDNVKDETYVREDMRKKEGPAVMAIHASRKADELYKSGNDIIIFDGLYSWSEYKFLENNYGHKLLSIAVTAPKKVRRNRVLNRKDSHRKYNIEQLIEREVAEIENIEKGGPIAYADYTINNSHDQDFLIQELKKVLKEEKII